MAVSPDGRTAVSTSTDRTARLWDLRSGTALGRPLAHADQVAAGTFSPDGRTVATASSDHTARLWDVATGLPLGPSLRHNGPVRMVAFAPDGGSLLTASLDGTGCLWRLPPAVAETPERIALEVRVRTGLELVGGQTIRALDATDWHELRGRLDPHR